MLFQFIHGSVNKSKHSFDFVTFNTEFERIGIAELNMTLTIMRSGTKVKGNLVIYNGLPLYSFTTNNIQDHIDPNKNVLGKNGVQLWQLKTPFWLEKHAASDTVFVYCGTDTLYVLLREIP